MAESVFPPRPSATEKALAKVVEALASLQFGEVTVIVHQGQASEVRVVRRDRL